MIATRFERSFYNTAYEQYRDALFRDGYCIMHDIIPRAEVARLSADLNERFAKTPYCNGDFYGRRTKRFGSLMTRSSATVNFVAHPLILRLVEAALGPWCDQFQLNLTQALELHPGERAQAPHRDKDMWRGATPEIEYLVNVMWPVSKFTAENGGTRIWPGSHQRQEEFLLPEEQSIAVEMEPGSACVFLGSTLHGGGANRSQEVRRGMIVSYSLGWLKPFENQWLIYPPEIARHFPRDIQKLVGYFQHRPNLGNVEGRCPSELLDGRFHDYLPAEDAFTPELAAQLKAYLEATT